MGLDSLGEGRGAAAARAEGRRLGLNDKPTQCIPAPALPYVGFQFEGPMLKY